MFYNILFIILFLLSVYLFQIENNISNKLDNKLDIKYNQINKNNIDMFIKYCDAQYDHSYQ